MIQVILRFLINILKVIKLNKKDESDLDFMRIKDNLNYFDQYQNVSKIKFIKYKMIIIKLIIYFLYQCHMMKIKKSDLDQ